MTAPIQIRMGGYGPPSTGFSRALKLIGDQLVDKLGPLVEIKYAWNIMDLGYRADDILWLVEHGLLTLGYQSSSYLTARVPELGVLDLPFLFRSEEAAQRAMDGRLGAFLAGKIEEHAHFRILGWFENGFRHVSNRVRPVHKPADLAGMRVRVLPSKVQARTFELMGAVPMPMDLTQAIELIKSGEVDAQENPLTNTVTYGVHKFHRFHTLTRHFYISRPIFLHRPTFDGWPEPVKAVMRAAIAHAVTWQRQQHGEEEKQARETIAAEGCQIAELALAEQEAFACAVSPLREEAVQIFGAGLLALAAAR